MKAIEHFIDVKSGGLIGRVAMPDEVSAGTALNLKRESLDRDYGLTFHNY